SEGDLSNNPKLARGAPPSANTDVTAARRFRSLAPERMTSPCVGRERGSLGPPSIHDRRTSQRVPSTSVPPTPGIMATDSWALAVDEQEAAAESLSNLHLKEEKIKPDANGAVVKTNANTEKTDEEEKEDRAAQSLLNKLIRSNLVDNTNQVEVLQRDPNSPLYSVKSFEELRLPQNLIAQSQSGTGKTAAFVLAMLSQVEPANRYPQCLCLSPTYELALQTGKVIEQMGKFYPELKLAYAVRGNKLERGQKISEQIVIGTPGTVLDWCSKLKFIDPKKIKVFVLDEADVMIATQGHQDQSIRIQRMLPRNCQMLLFSATFEETVWNFAKKVVPEPNIIKLKREEETLDTIKQYYVLCNNRDEKFQALCNLYGAITIAQAMIFCHVSRAAAEACGGDGPGGVLVPPLPLSQLPPTRKTASWLAAELSKEGHQVALLSGEMMVEQRAAVIERFREGKEKVLVTTNVCARGIDVEQVSVVINFDLPVDKDGNPDNETYLHRIGRTGRFGKRGLAVNMVDSKHSMNILNRIQEHFRKSASIPQDHGHRLVGPGSGRAGGGCQVEDRAAQSLLNKLIRSNLVDNTNQVEVLQRDPNSPLYSVKSFEELRLKPQLLQGVYAMGFNRPSKIQENALPMMLAEPPQNLIAQSQSGTGKTAAFVLAMLSRVEPAERYPQCLCLSPTYELSLQTGKVIEQMGKFHPELKLAYAVRGNKLERGQKISEQIVIGTPGTVLDWCSKLKFIDPKKIKVFVLDEADVMIATQGHQDQSIRIQRMLPRNCQMLLFSATFEETVWNFAKKVVPEPNIIKLKREEETLDTIKQYYVLCNNRDEKFQALCNLYGAITIAQAMIFCHVSRAAAEACGGDGPGGVLVPPLPLSQLPPTRKTASWLAAELSKEGHQVALLSGEMMVEQRAAVIERFREGKEKVLVTTNVCARGIDVEQVSVVINFDLPVDKDGNPDNETYLHRIGRTGRFGKRGLAVNMVDSKHSMNILNRIQEHFNKKIERLDTDDLDEIEKIAN
ncbi:ATP-dependent RNA helicase DDX19A, partial [Galemys pyrenaicus]